MKSYLGTKTICFRIIPYFCRYCIKAKKKPSTTNDNIDMTDFYDDDYDLDDDDDYGDEDEEAAEDTDDSGNGN